MEAICMVRFGGFYGVWVCVRVMALFWVLSPKAAKQRMNTPTRDPVFDKVKTSAQSLARGEAVFQVWPPLHKN